MIFQRRRRDAFLILLIKLLLLRPSSSLVGPSALVHRTSTLLRVSKLNATDAAAMLYADYTERTKQVWDLPTFLVPLKKKQPFRSTQQYKVYCDLDGVLVDFGHGISEAFGVHIPVQNIDALPRGLLWEKVQQVDRFFEHLPWIEGGRELWETIRVLQPDILTGVPSYCNRAPRDEKFAWCLRELVQCTDEIGTIEHVDKAAPLRTHSSVRTRRHSIRPAPWNCKIITCWSERKHHESGPNKVLIDDRIDLKEAWEAKGGIFIHHRNTPETIEQLRQKGILPSQDAWRSPITP